MKRSKQTPDQWVVWVADIGMITHVYSPSSFSRNLISGKAQRSACFKEPWMILIHAGITENDPREHSADIWLTSFRGKEHKPISNLFMPKQQECIDGSGWNVQEQIFEVKVKLDPGAERKSSRNFFCLPALFLYLWASCLGRIWLEKVSIWY